MNNTTENNDEQNELMSETEMKDFVNRILARSNYSVYTMDALMFMFLSLGKMAEQSSLNVQDLCDRMQSFIFAETFHSSVAQNMYQQIVANRFRTLDYSISENNPYQTAEMDIQEYVSNFVNSQTPESVETKAETKQYDINALFSGLLVNPETPPVVVKAITEHFAALHTAEQETETQLDLSDERERFYNQIWANKISYVLASPDVSDEAKNAISAILDVIANESNTGVYDEPEVLKVGFPLQMEKLSSDVRRAFVLSLDSVMRNSLETSVYNEVEKMSVRFEDKETPLDLSEMSADALNTDDRKSETRRAAECLSEIINNPNMPVELRNGILEGLDGAKDYAVSNHTDLLKYSRSPDYIETLLNLSEANQ